MKIKNVKDLVKRVKLQTIDWEKIFANHITHKGLVSRKYYFKNTQNSTIRKNKQPTRK